MLKTYRKPVQNIQYVPCIYGEPVVLPTGAWACSNPQTDPFTPPYPQGTHEPPIVPINCGRHQAPSGYYYKSIAGRCILFKRHGGVVHSQAGTGVILQQPNAVAGISNVAANATNWIKNHALLSLALAAGAYYIFTKKQ